MKLKGFKVAILLCDGFEEVEMVKPRKALKKEKATVHLISPKNSSVKSCVHNKWHQSYSLNRSLKNLDPAHYDALVLPGGVINPDKLRTYPAAITFIDHFLRTNKPVAAICHGPLSLVETKRLKGRKMTSYPSIKSDLRNAGAKWVNRPVVVDRNLITSRKPADLTQFNQALIKSCQLAQKDKQRSKKTQKEIKKYGNKRFVNC